MSVRKDLFPDIQPYDEGMLQVSDIHSIYYEQSGNKDGNPVIFILTPVFNTPGPYRVISFNGGGNLHEYPKEITDLGQSWRPRWGNQSKRQKIFDQRGAGKSLPAYELRENTTWNLVSDIEKLREYLKIEKWIVFGGSWGSTLGLAYSETHPDRVKAMILRGIFTCRRKELLWFYQEGASIIYPDKFDEYKAVIPEVERGDIMGAYYRRLTKEDDLEERLRSAQAWSKWEMATSRLMVDEDLLKRADLDTWCLQFARIECHYFVHGAFLKWDSQLLDDADKLRDIPLTIVQGRYDVVCPMDTAWSLHKKLPDAEFHIVQDAGHSTKENGIMELLLQATEKYKNLK